MAQNTMVRWVVRNGRWTFGVSGLVLEAENDQFFKGQPQRLLDELACWKELISFREDEGADEHCHEGALSLFHQRTFDWVDTVLAS